MACFIQHGEIIRSKSSSCCCHCRLCQSRTHPRCPQGWTSLAKAVNPHNCCGQQRFGYRPPLEPRPLLPLRTSGIVVAAAAASISSHSSSGSTRASKSTLGFWAWMAPSGRSSDGAAKRTRERCNLRSTDGPSLHHWYRANNASSRSRGLGHAMVLVFVQAVTRDVL